MHPPPSGSAGPRVLILLVALAAAALWFASTNRPVEQVASFERPDGRYRVVVLRQPSRWSMMPGQGSDAPGVVQLLDQRGHKLAEAKVAAVQMVEQVRWEDRRARIKLVADWPLPD